MLTGVVYYDRGKRAFVGRAAPYTYTLKTSLPTSKQRDMREALTPLAKGWSEIATKWVRPVSPVRSPTSNGVRSNPDLSGRETSNGVHKPDGTQTLFYPETSPDKITLNQRKGWEGVAKRDRDANRKRLRYYQMGEKLSIPCYKCGGFHRRRRHLRPAKRCGIIPRGAVLTSGYNAYIRHNMYAYSVGWGIPRFEPPFLSGKASPPEILGVWIEGDKIMLAIEEGSYPRGFLQRAIRIWATIQYCGLGYEFSIVGAVELTGKFRPNDQKGGQSAGRSEPSAGLGKRRPIHLVVVDVFDVSKHTWGVEEVSITDLDGGRATFQCDAVTAKDEDTGAIVSAVGNMKDVELPRRKENGKIKKIKEHVRRYKRTHNTVSPISKLKAKIAGEIYRAENKEKIKISKQKWEKENREKINAKHRKRYKEDAEFRRRIKASKKKWVMKNKEKACGYVKKYNQKNRERINAQRRERRARKKKEGK
ncbi:MAG: hypothetical protein A2W23_00925 [Planctomycetes bacterium RBG_16_43_13]|nr:MAG: hypothetical protein A2W23_00925 [Planctomycetes bacterium RBG_16_43_13]